MEPSDEALVLACRHGDATAWETLVDRYQRLIYTICRHAGLDEEHAADVFQRVFESLFAHLAEIEQPAMIGSWLATTARHEAWRLSRRERLARVSGSSGDPTLPALDTVPPPDELLLRIEEQVKVRDAVAMLDPRCRRLLALLFYEAEPPTYTVVASALGMSEGSVGPTRARCLQKLRRLLEESDF